MSSYTPFIILSPGRSGSNLLMFSLKAHPEVRCFGEVFNFFAESVDFLMAGYDDHNTEDRVQREKDPVEFLRRRIYGKQPEGLRAVGFKAMYQHLAFLPELCQELAGMQNLCIIHSKRRNMLRSLVSLRIAEKTGEWVAPIRRRAATRSWARAFQDGLEPARRIVRTIRRRNRSAEAKAVTLTPEECAVYFEWTRRLTGEYAELFRGHAMVDVYYEDIVQDGERTLAGMQSFLGLTPGPLSLGTRRQNPEPLCDLITNYDELRKAFIGTEYAAFFDE